MGQQAGLHFPNGGGAQVRDLNGQMTSHEGQASISDKSGNLLFYSNGVETWDASHALMLTQSGLRHKGGTVHTAPQGVNIICDPGNCKQYFLFLGDAGNNDSIFYCKVDMSLPGNGTTANPLGDIVAGTKNTFLSANKAEHFTATHHANGIDWWIIIPGINSFDVYLLTAAGINSVPVYSGNGGTSYTIASIAGSTRASHDGSKIAIASGATDAYLYNFNNATGVISNQVNLGPFTTGIYGLEFSPDSKVLYFTSSSQTIFQFDLSLASASIPGSKLALGATNSALVGGMQLGPNGKIYYAMFSSSTLGVINNPNVVGVGCNHVPGGYNLFRSTYHLPQFFEPAAILAAFTPSKTTACVGSTISFNNTSQYSNSYEWWFGDPASGINNTSILQTPSHTYGSTGIYTVTLIAGQACHCELDTITQTIIIVPPPTATLTVTNATCGNSNGSITANVNGGTPGYSYSWSASGATTLTASGLSGGIYSVTVTDNVGCIHTSTASVTQSPLLQAFIPTYTNVACNGFATGAAGGAALGGTPGYLYQWSNGQTTAVSTGLQATGYTVTITDANACTAKASISITQPTSLAAFVPAQTNIACNGNATGGAMATALGGTGGYTYLWSSVPMQNNQTSSGLSAGTYSVMVTDANGCTAQTTVSITEPPVLVSNINQQNNVLCNGNSTGLISAVAAGGAGVYTYSWNTNPSQNTSAISNLAAGTYSLTITDGNGCTFQIGTNITQPTLLATTNAAATPAHCSQPDGTATLNAGGGSPNYNYQWNNGQTNAVATNLVSGIYSITVTDANGCTAVTAVNVPNSSGVNVQLSNVQPSLCFASCDGFATAAGNGGNAPYVYAWNTVPAQNNSMASGLCAGVYNVTVTDANGCTDTMNIAIAQPQQININVSQSPIICIGQYAALTAGATGGSPNYTFAWQPGNVNGSSINVNPVIPTTYSLEVTDANGCSVMATSIVNVHTALQVVAAIPAAICAGSNVQLSALGNGGNGNYNFTWYPGGVTGNQTIVSPNTTTTYSVVVTDNCGTPADTTFVTVLVNQLPVVSFTATDSVGCEPLCLQLSNTTLNAVSCSWNLGDGTISSSSNPAHCYYNSGAYSVSLTVTDQNNCIATLVKPNWIIVHPNPTAAFSINPQTTTILNPAIQFFDQSLLATAWSWSFGDVANSGSVVQHPTFIYSDTGVYAVQLIVTNEFGCTDTAQDRVRIFDDNTFYTPNSFTPNGDGKNDNFLPMAIGVEVDEFEMWIYNRWGDQIFYTDNIKEGWDGRANNGNFSAQQDTYVWKINSKNNKGQLSRYVGHVNLIR